MRDEEYWTDTLLVANEADALWLPDIPDVQIVFNPEVKPGMFYRVGAAQYAAGRRRNPCPTDALERMEITLCRLVKRRRANLKLLEDVEGRISSIDEQIARMRLVMRELNAVSGVEGEA